MGCLHDPGAEGLRGKEADLDNRRERQDHGDSDEPEHAVGGRAVQGSEREHAAVHRVFGGGAVGERARRSIPRDERDAPGTGAANGLARRGR